ncbi:MAG: helix-turn-helix transcriptional regulator [Dermatophilaceae bacterium]
MTDRPPLDTTPYTTLIEAVVALLHPRAEVVVHDVPRDRIVAIWNSFSGRKVGDPSLLGELPANDDGHHVLGPYEKVGSDGHRITSVTVTIADGQGLICINLDRSPLDEAIAILSRFAAPLTSPPPELFERDWREQINSVVDDWLRQRHLDRARLTRGDRVELVRELDGRGVFAIRHAAHHVARALGSSRATIYSLLQEARK